VEVVASLSQGRTAATQCGLFTHKSVPVIFEPPCNMVLKRYWHVRYLRQEYGHMLIFNTFAFSHQQCLRKGT